MARSSRPPLTTIDMQLGELGRTAAELLREAIDGHPRPGRHTLPCRLVARDSTPQVPRRPSSSP